MRLLLLSAGAAVAVLAGSVVADGAVRKVAIASPVRAGGVASLTVTVSPRARCTIAPAAGTYVAGPGLGPKTGGRITWRWRLRSTARAGRSRVRVSCGASGALRPTFVIAEPELPLPAAVKAACARVQDRVRSRYRTELIPLLERTLVALREQYGAFDCAWGSNYYKDGGPLSYYLVSVKRGKAPCSYAVTARVEWVSDPPLPGYRGPVDETYAETCASLRS